VHTGSIPVGASCEETPPGAGSPGSRPTGTVVPTMRTARRSAARPLLFAALAVAVVVAAVALIPSLGDLNPFRTETVDRSPPVVLKSLERLSEYRASSANLQVIVDVERDAGVLPDFIKGERTLLVAVGTVDGVVNFRGLRGRNLQVNEDRTAVTLTLPAARLSDARLDLDRTRVFDRERGLVDRIGDAFGGGGADDERRLLQLAQRRLAEAAARDPEVRRAAERNTRSMLEGMMRGLGFRRVTIRFAPESGT
jgi:Protein of unknown function (DUF4230)